MLVELVYESGGDIFYCGDYESLEEAVLEMNRLSIEFPQNDYWYEITYDDEMGDN